MFWFFFFHPSIEPKKKKKKKARGTTELVVFSHGTIGTQNSDLKGKKKTNEEDLQGPDKVSQQGDLLSEDT